MDEIAACLLTVAEAEKATAVTTKAAALEKQAPRLREPIGLGEGRLHSLENPESRFDENRDSEESGFQVAIFLKNGPRATPIGFVAPDGSYCPPSELEAKCAFECEYEARIAASIYLEGSGADDLVLIRPSGEKEVLAPGSI